MDPKIEKTISNFVQNQFPQFYQEEGENFILFVKTYFEWMETEGQPIREARQLFEYRDIDTTIERFLEYFQKKYLYGIPFNIIANKRFLLKHILNVYRSKGTIQGYKLLFRLIYNEDVDVYLPGKDVLRVSDGKWVEPKYLELSWSPILDSLVDKTIYGVSSSTTAVVERIVRERFNKDEIYVMYINDVAPKGGDFIVSEKIVDNQFKSNSELVSLSPTILGSLDRLDIFNSGNSFNVGDVLKIAYKDLDTNEIDSFGDQGLIVVTSLFRGFGSLNFNIRNGGFGFTANAAVFLYKNILDQTGQGASFDIKIADVRRLTYNTDLFLDFMDLQLDEIYGFSKYQNANSASTLDECFSYETNDFGRISALTNVLTGNGYIAPANVFIRSTYRSKNVPGRLTWYNSNDFINAYSTDVYVNTSFISNNVILIANAVKHYDTNAYLDYIVPAGNTAINGLTANTRYYVKTTNTLGITLSATQGGTTLNINTAVTSNTTERHSFITKALTKSFFANTTSVNNASYSILVTAANTYFYPDDYVYYLVPSGNTGILGITPNSFYYVESSNSTAITLSDTFTGNSDPIEIATDVILAGETHYLLNDTKRNIYPYVNGYSTQVYANTFSINNTSYAFMIANADIYFSVNDRIYYDVPVGNTAIANLRANSVVYIKTSNSSAITLSNTAGGPVMQIYTSSSGAAETHTIKTAKFSKYFANDDVIYLQSNSTNANTLELAVIRNVISDLSIQLYGFTNNSSTSNSLYGRAVVIMPSQFDISEFTGRNRVTGNSDIFSILSYTYSTLDYTNLANIMKRLDGTINGINDNIEALNSSGNNIVENVSAINSGKAYVEGESVRAYRYGILQVPTVLKGGTGYVNGDTIIFSGGITETPARGSILTNSQGNVVSVNTSEGAWYGGVGYNALPGITIRSANSAANGAVLSTNYIPFDTANEIRGLVRKGGIGRGLGYWATTDSLLNSDKVIQDSYYYQDYSYELRTALSLDTYKEVFYSTFHTAGSALFGKYELQPFVLSSNIELNIDTGANTSWPLWLTCDIADPRIRADVYLEELANGYPLPGVILTVDQFTFSNNYFGCDINTVYADSTEITSDRFSEDLPT
jgi:hypothetical protein